MDQLSHQGDRNPWRHRHQLVNRSRLPMDNDSGYDSIPNLLWLQSGSVQSAVEKFQHKGGWYNWDQSCVNLNQSRIVLQIEKFFGRNRNGIWQRGLTDFSNSGLLLRTGEELHLPSGNPKASIKSPACKATGSAVRIRKPNLIVQRKIFSRTRKNDLPLDFFSSLESAGLGVIPKEIAWTLLVGMEKMDPPVPWIPR